MKTAMLIITAWVAVSLALPGLFYFFRRIRTARRMAQRQAMIDRVQNASARYDRVLTMTDSAATRQTLTEHVLLAEKARLEAAEYDRLVRTCDAVDERMARELNSPHPRALDRLYHVDEQGKPVMMRKATRPEDGL